jgi:hypothetical protein
MVKVFLKARKANKPIGRGSMFFHKQISQKEFSIIVAPRLDVSQLDPARAELAKSSSQSWRAQASS